MRLRVHTLAGWILLLSVSACGAGEFGTGQDDPSRTASSSPMSSSFDEVCPADHVDLSKIYPWPLDKTFVLRHYNEAGTPLPDPPEQAI
jgi:hypothetical protein